MNSAKPAALGSIVVLLVIAVLLWAPWNRQGVAEGEQLILYCAAGMLRPVEKIADQYEREYGVRILIEPASSLTRQYEALLQTDGIKLKFLKDGIEALADIAYQVNQSTQNIGARRLHTVMERVVEDLSFTAPERSGERVTIDADYVRAELDDLVADEDLSKYIL